MLIRVSKETLIYCFLELIAPTRFSAKPNFGSTFGNFQQEKNCPGFISEKDRLAKSTSTAWRDNSLNAKISFQMEDKMRATKLQEARLNSKRANLTSLQDSLSKQTASQDTMYQQKLMMKAQRQDNYNLLCHLNQ